VSYIGEYVFSPSKYQEVLLKNNCMVKTNQIPTSEQMRMLSINNTINKLQTFQIRKIVLLQMIWQGCFCSSKLYLNLILCLRLTQVNLCVRLLSKHVLRKFKCHIYDAIYIFCYVHFTQHVTPYIFITLKCIRSQNYKYYA